MYLNQCEKCDKSSEVQQIDIYIQETNWTSV